MNWYKSSESPPNKRRSEILKRLQLLKKQEKEVEKQRNTGDLLAYRNSIGKIKREQGNLLDDLDVMEKLNPQLRLF